MGACLFVLALEPAWQSGVRGFNAVSGQIALLSVKLKLSEKLELGFGRGCGRFNLTRVEGNEDEAVSMLLVGKLLCRVFS